MGGKILRDWGIVTTSRDCLIERGKGTGLLTLFGGDMLQVPKIPTTSKLASQIFSICRILDSNRASGLETPVGAESCRGIWGLKAKIFLGLFNYLFF